MPSCTRGAGCEFALTEPQELYEALARGCGGACETYALEHLKQVWCIQQAHKHSGRKVVAAVQLVQVGECVGQELKPCRCTEVEAQRWCSRGWSANCSQPSHVSIRTRAATVLRLSAHKWEVATGVPRSSVETDNVLPEMDLGMLLRLKNHMLGHTC
ncbi:hypothetical protein B0H10DRAFT_1956730 [Mycena sp. CBHHK59/15]|nr:hypothetical protein B0H10DRAFT_1956730 [Mycena sp. CBHHK59/15]